MFNYDLPIEIQIFLLSWIAGLAMPFGAFLASFESLFPKYIDDEIKHFIAALGGGALLSAIALVFIPEAIKVLNIFYTSIYFLFGGVLFAFLNNLLNKSQTKIANFMAMLSDFIPETLALGTLMATRSPSAFLITFLMAMQNIPEAFTTYREMKTQKPGGKNIILFLFLIPFIGPIMGFIGFYFLSGYPNIIASIELVASGGILYLVFQDIAPQVKLEKNWFPPLGAILGFLMGVVGHMLQ